MPEQKLEEEGVQRREGEWAKHGGELQFRSLAEEAARGLDQFDNQSFRLNDESSLNVKAQRPWGK